MSDRNGTAYADDPDGVELDDSTTIDDLLRFEEEPPPKPRRRAVGVGWWVRTLLVAGGAAAVTVFALRLFGFEISIPLCVAGYLALLLLRRVTGSLAPPPARRGVRSRDGGEEDGMYDFTERDALRPAVARWERLLTRAGADTGSARAMHRTLAELADERLRQRHALTRDGDPARAKDLLGDALWDYLTTPPTRNLAPRDAAAYVQSLERL